MKTWFTILILMILGSTGFSQVAGFTIPDTVCEDKPVHITDVMPAGASSYRWSFCAGNASQEPDGLNLGNPDQLFNAPRYITIVQDGDAFYTFVTCTGNGKVIRHYFGSSLTQFPLVTTDLGSFGTLSDQVRGIQVKEDNGNWFGFVAERNMLIRLVFGNSPANTPTAEVIPLPQVTTASGLSLAREGTTYAGFCTDLDGNRLIHLVFNLGLANNPVVSNLGNTGQLNGPASIILSQDNGAWYGFISNINDKSLTRVSLGSSLLTPAVSAVNLSNINGLNLNAGITLINECGTINGFVTNCVNESDLCIVHLTFPGGISGPINGYIIPNNGILNKPFGISEFIRQGDTLYAYVANYGSSSITRMFFPSCSSLAQPYSTLKDPPPVTYPDPGNYNILLTVNNGLPNQSAMCRNIVVVPRPVLSLGPDKAICEGEQVVLDAGAGDSLYAWSTGATTRTITVDATGTYSVHVVTFQDCDTYDTISITVNFPVASQVDTTICEGLKYWAQQAYQTTAGVYYDTLQRKNGCDSIVTTNLLYEECRLQIWFPNAFTPNGDGLNDFFKPKGANITKYRLMVYNRWGTLVFETENFETGWDGTFNGEKPGPDVYTYDVVFESTKYPGVAHHEKGTVTIVE